MNEYMVSKSEIKRNEKADWKERRKVRRAKKIMRFRPLKNFLWWFAGFITFIVFVVSTAVIGVTVIPISTYVKLAGVQDVSAYVSDNVSSKSLLDSVKDIGNYTMEDVPAIKLAVNSLVGALNSISADGSQLVLLDETALDALKTVPVIGNLGEFVSQLSSCLRVTATIKSFGIDLGDFGNLNVIKDFDLITSDAELNAFKADGTAPTNPKLFYYEESDLVTVVGVDGLSASAFDDSEEPAEEPTYVYKRAFNDDGTLVSALSELSAEKINSLKFFYPALNSIPLSDFTAIFSLRFKSMTVKSIIQAFSSDVTDDNVIIKLVGDETLSTLGSFDSDEIKLTDVLDAPADEMPLAGDPDYDAKLAAYNKNREIYDILKDATGKATYEEITVADLSEVETDNIKLSTVLPAPTSDVASEKPLEDDPDYETKLKAYNDYNTNRQLYNILMQATNKPVVNCASYQALKVGDLNNLDMGKVKILTVMELSAEDDLYNIIQDVVGAPENATLDDMANNFDVGKLKLETVFDKRTVPNPADYATTEEYNEALAEYNNNNKLWLILNDSVTPSEADGKIRVKDLETGFDIEKVKLSTLMSSSDNKILAALLAEDAANVSTVGYVPVTVGTIGIRLNNLEISEVYDINCFTTVQSEARLDGRVYYKTIVEGKEVYSSTGTGTPYYVSKTASVWLFLLYNAENVDVTTSDPYHEGTGFAERYTEKGLKMNEMDGSIASVSSGIMYSTIRQLYDAGVLDTGYVYIYGMRIIDVVGRLNSLMST